MTDLSAAIPQADLPVLYSFRRCPYAMRARLALSVSDQCCELREILLRDKPDAMIAASPKASVPVLHLPDGQVIDESLDIMLWALHRADPDHWLSPQSGDLAEMLALIAGCDGSFKQHLDRYKYATRYGADTDPLHHRQQAMQFVNLLESRLQEQRQLFGNRPSLADFAIFTFIRQFAHTDRDWFDAQPLPGVQTWLAGHLASDLFAGVMEKFPRWQSGDPARIFPMHRVARQQ